MPLEYDFSTHGRDNEESALTPDQLRALHAKSVSSALLPLLQTPHLPLTCLSRHDHAYNFKTPDGAIIALVTLRHGNGPFHIVLPHPLPPQLTNHDNIHAHWRQKTLSIGALRIDLEQASIWQPDLPALHHLSFNAFPSLHEAHNQYPPSPLRNEATALGKRAQHGIEALQMGFSQKDSNTMGSGVLALAGLGPGLTPAGDDFLVGLLAAFHACRTRLQEDQSNVCRLIAQTAAPQTTQLSGQWLRCAGQGHFGEAWHHLITALNNDSSAAISTAAHRILTTGATSGVDAMSGFLFGISLLQGR